MRILQSVAVLVIAAGALVVGQGPEAVRVLNEMRAALGGDTLAAVKTLAINGRSARSVGQFQLAGEFEILCELPDKYVKKETISMGASSTVNTLGFNGDTLIQENAGGPMTMNHGGATMIIRTSPGFAGPGAQLTPEQQTAMRATQLRAAKSEFSRLMVALFGASFSGNPVEFSYEGQAEAPEGKADVIGIKGAGEFAAKLFVDGKTRRPLMLSWKAPGPQIRTSGGGGEVSTSDVPQVVEHRLYLSEYRDVDGVKLPHQLIRSIDGNTTEEITFEKFRLNTKIDEKKFR